MLETKRLKLRLLKEGDESLLFPLHADPDVMLKIGPPDSNLEHTKEKVRDNLNYMRSHPGHGIFLAFLADEFIGWGVLVHIEKNEEYPIEVGYRLHKKFWGQGFATEIALALRDHAKKIGVEVLAGITAQDNLASMRVLEKIGMQFRSIQKYYNLYVQYYEMQLT